ncbi:hypothetical protein SAMN05428974_2779 [Sphingopyxis sp. YR583]|uniref:hypothetical protein n=1 Tax=Sphingopyxis sp. YR583 TaxID=1881047 RepID=UPI0008A73CEE|nr:hypothetical protein [Sphingopyxis sp. YR583]SEH18545.1 hypothetical protein SAMN05428974_2779 [Sphingopyxis sp. YR583]
MNWKQFAQLFAITLPLTVIITVILRVLLQWSGDFSQWQATLTPSNVLLSVVIAAIIARSIVRHKALYGEDQ